MILHVDANNLYGWAISQSWLYDEIKFDKNVELEVTLNTPDDLDIGYLMEHDFLNPENMKEKTNKFPLCSEGKISPQGKFIE